MQLPRAHEVAVLQEAVKRCDAETLHGLPGAGKSTLVWQRGHEYAVVGVAAGGDEGGGGAGPGGDGRGAARAAAGRVRGPAPSESGCGCRVGPAGSRMAGRLPEPLAPLGHFKRASACLVPVVGEKTNELM